MSDAELRAAARACDFEALPALLRSAPGNARRRGLIRLLEGVGCPAAASWVAFMELRQGPFLRDWSHRSEEPWQAHETARRMVGRPFLLALAAAAVRRLLEARVRRERPVPRLILEGVEEIAAGKAFTPSATRAYWSAVDAYLPDFYANNWNSNSCLSLLAGVLEDSLERCLYCARRVGRDEESERQRGDLINALWAEVWR